MMDKYFRKILIVDDDLGMRETLEVILKGAYQVILAENGEFALEVLEKDKGILLVLLDIILPSMNGIEVLKRIKEMQIEAGVIMMSVVRDAEVVVESMKLGAMDYITKEFDFDGVLNMVGKAIDEIEKKRVPELS